MSKAIGLLIGAALAAAGLAPAHAGEGYPWRQHAPPFDFQFGNDIDTHQQTRLDRAGNLSGFFYIRYTGVVTKDRYPVATHVDCNSAPDCVVGWMLDGKPVKAAFLHHPMHDHPIFAMGRADIPQPGSYSHFHWLGQAMPQMNLPADGYVLQLSAINRFCFIHHMADAATSAASCRDNGGVAVEVGGDIATHLNISPAAAHGM